MMTKFRNNKSNKNQGIHTIFGQHSVKAALQNDKREHIELIISKNQINFAKKYESTIEKIYQFKDFTNIYLILNE